MTPRVAIITRTKDRLRLLKRALASVEKQTCKDWRHVIVNDGGDRKALEAFLEGLQPAHRDKLKVIHHERPEGMQAASNAGIQASDSDFICMHDDDDYWDPEYLQHVIAFLDEEGAESPFQGVITHTTEITEKIAKDGSIRELSRRPYIPLEEISIFRMGYENPFPPIAFCYRRKAWDQVGPYDPRWDVIGDMDFNLRFLLSYEIGVIKKPLANYCLRPGAGNGDEQNSVAAKNDLHKRLFAEFKNTHFRRAKDPVQASLAFGLGSASYLVEAQWMLDTVFHRSREVQEALEKLTEGVSLAGYEDRFSTLREGLAILVDHARNPEVRDALKAVRGDLRHGVSLQETLSQRLEALIRSVGLIEDARAPGIIGLLHEVHALLADPERNGVSGRAAALDTLLQRINLLQTAVVDRLNEIAAHEEAHLNDISARFSDLAARQEAHLNDLAARQEAHLNEAAARQEAHLNEAAARQEAILREILEGQKALASRLEAMEETFHAKFTHLENGALKLWMGPVKLGRIMKTRKKPS